jgi:hypothetical protein
MKYFHNSDVEHLGKASRVRLAELRKVMTDDSQDVAAAAKGFPAANNMDHMMANTSVIFTARVLSLILFHHKQTKAGMAGIGPFLEFEMDLSSKVYALRKGVKILRRCTKKV